MIKRTTLLIILLITAGALAEVKSKKPLLRDGFVLMGIDGKAVARGDKWLFEIDRDISDGQSVVRTGTKIPMLPSAGLEKMIADMTENAGGSYRLYNAMVTRYGGENYLFCDYFVPLFEPEPQSRRLAEVSEAVSNEPVEPNDTAVEVMINEPNDAVMIPQEIIDKLTTRRIIRPEKLKKGMELKQDSILADRTGFIKKSGDGWAFEFDAIGRNTSNVTLELLPCQVLAKAEARQGKRVGQIRFKVSGIVTKCQDRYYLLLQTARRSYSHGNFGG